MAYIINCPKKKKITVAENRKYKKTNFVQSSLKSHPFWVTQYLKSELEFYCRLSIPEFPFI